MSLCVRFLALEFDVTAGFEDIPPAYTHISHFHRNSFKTLVPAPVVLALSAISSRTQPGQRSESDVS